MGSRDPLTLDPLIPQHIPKVGSIMRRCSVRDRKRENATFAESRPVPQLISDSKNTFDSLSPGSYKSQLLLLSGRADSQQQCTNRCPSDSARGCYSLIQPELSLGQHRNENRTSESLTVKTLKTRTTSGLFSVISFHCETPDRFASLGPKYVFK